MQKGRLVRRESTARRDDPGDDHPAAVHDAVAPIGVIRAAIVAAVIGRTKADREARRGAPAEPAPTAMAMPVIMPATTMPSGFGGFRAGPNWQP